MAALQHFFDAERTRRGWSMREAAKRSKISPSKAYAIANGDDNVEFETFENIAAAFSMSPAELAVAIGKGAVNDDPRRVPIHAALRNVPDEQLATVELMIRSLAVQPVNKGPYNRLRDGTDNRRVAHRRALDEHSTPQDDTDINGGITRRNQTVKGLLLNVMTAIGGPLWPSNPTARPRGSALLLPV